jgi:hypothetical protein
MERLTLRNVCRFEIIFYPENGSSRFLRTFDVYLPEYTASHPRIQ